MQTEDFVTFDQAKKLKELGFDWGCIHWYHTNEEHEKKLIKAFDYANHSGLSPRALSAPTLSQVQKWLREVKNIVVLATCNLDYEKGHEWYWFIDKDVNIEDPEHAYETYEAALEAGINKALEFIKNN